MTIKLYAKGDTLTWANDTGSDVANGAVVLIGTPPTRIGVTNGAIASLATGTVIIEGVVQLVKIGSGGDVDPGDTLYWDESASNLTLEKNGNIYAGICWKASLSAAVVVQVKLDGGEFHISIPEHDCASAAADSLAKNIVPIGANTGGLIIERVYGKVTEVFAGTEDQGVVTVQDSDDNTIATLTPSDAGADALGDIIVGYQIDQASTGDALKTVAADKGVQSILTTATTTASGAGKMTVHVDYKAL